MELENIIIIHNKSYRGHCFIYKYHKKDSVYLYTFLYIGESTFQWLYKIKVQYTSSFELDLEKYLNQVIIHLLT